MKNQTTIVLWVMVFAGLVAPLMAQQEIQTKPKINDAPLTDEQVAIYRAVLKDWSHSTEPSVNLANTRTQWQFLEPCSIPAVARNSISKMRIKGFIAWIRESPLVRK